MNGYAGKVDDESDRRVSQQVTCLGAANDLDFAIKHEQETQP